MANQAQSFCRTIQRMCNSKPSLPPEYQQVEYLQSSGTQYIRTGLYNADGLKVTFQTVAYVYEGGVAMARTGATMYDRFGIGWYTHQGEKLIFMTSGWNGLLMEDYKNHTIAFGANTGWDLIVDGNVIETIPSSARNTVNLEMYLFRDNARNKNGKCKIYNAKFYKSGTLVRDIYPCYRKSDNKSGMYDLVTDTFYTNAGSGEFTVGADV